MTLIDFIVTVFVINMLQQENLKLVAFCQKLANSEVITMEIVAEYLGFYKDKAIYRYFKQHWQCLFPELPDRTNFIRQSANLWKVKQMFFKHLTEHYNKWLQIIDSMPIEVCKFVRAKNTKLFKDSASYGKWFGQTFSDTGCI